MCLFLSALLHDILIPVFGFLMTDKNLNTFVCKMCKQTIQTKSGNITDLICQLNCFHPLEYATSCQSQSSTLTMKSSESTQQHNHNTIWKITQYRDITLAVLYYIVVNMLLFNVVGKHSFRKLFNVGNMVSSCHVVPGREQKEVSSVS